jgi:hypothetical protein
LFRFLSKSLNELGLDTLDFELFSVNNLHIKGVVMSERTVFQIKLLVCGAVLTGTIGFMVHLLWPALDLVTTGLYVLAGWGILAGVMLTAATEIAIYSWINQWILRKGGTDTQWLWFPADPPGMQEGRSPKKP